MPRLLLMISAMQGYDDPGKLEAELEKNRTEIAALQERIRKLVGKRGQPQHTVQEAPKFVPPVTKETL